MQRYTVRAEDRGTQTAVATIAEEISALYRDEHGSYVVDGYFSDEAMLNVREKPGIRRIRYNNLVYPEGVARVQADTLNGGGGGGSGGSTDGSTDSSNVLLLAGIGAAAFYLAGNS